ncbi:MAG: hypothetical protein HY810_05405, partial [Candidatus Omnitrophica bacterium]|nr:hypothetical protein [Candidatus Omnitrophota bacterium]
MVYFNMLIFQAVKEKVTPWMLKTIRGWVLLKSRKSIFFKIISLILCSAIILIDIPPVFAFPSKYIDQQSGKTKETKVSESEDIDAEFKFLMEQTQSLIDGYERKGIAEKD